MDSITLQKFNKELFTFLKVDFFQLKTKLIFKWSLVKQQYEVNRILKMSLVSIKECIFEKVLTAIFVFMQLKAKRNGLVK